MKKLLFSALAVVCLSGITSPAQAGYEHEFLNPASVTALELGTDTDSITYTLRSAAAAITPAISVSIADNILSGTASATATTAIASGATVAVAVASTGNIGTVPFRCDISYAY